MGLTSANSTDYSYCDILSSNYMQKRIPLSAQPKASERDENVSSAPAVPSALLFSKPLIIFARLHHKGFSHDRLRKVILEDLEVHQLPTGVAYSDKMIKYVL